MRAARALCTALGFAVRVTRAAAPRTGLDAYVLNAKPAELGTGIGPQLRAELEFAQTLRKLAAEEAAAADATPAAAAAAPA